MYGIYCRSATPTNMSDYIKRKYLADEKYSDVDVSCYRDVVAGSMRVYLRRGDHSAAFEFTQYDLEGLDEKYMDLAINHTLKRLDKEEENDVRGIEG